MQGIWCASASAIVEKPLYTDAGSGLLFILKGRIQIENTVLSEGIWTLSVSKHASNIVIPAGGCLLGIRFMPAVGRTLLGPYYRAEPSRLAQDELRLDLPALYTALLQQPCAADQLALLYQWAAALIDTQTQVPSALIHSLDAVQENAPSSTLQHTLPLSLRQVERQFNHWLGMTPKHYQRIVRIRYTIHYLKQHDNLSLAQVALDCGFSDQAHMTREFRSLTGKTPQQVHAHKRT